MMLTTNFFMQTSFQLTPFSFLIRLFQSIEELIMELQYPTHPENNLSYQISNIDQRYGSVIFSTPNLPLELKPLSASLKKTLLRHIITDQYTSLLTLMERKGVRLTHQISKKGLGWNILHYIAKHNADKCLQYCLKKAFQQNPKSYHKILETKTTEEDTPLLIAFQSKSNRVIKTLLEFGGVDIYAMNIRKMTAYQIAEMNSNEEGLKMLMKYELKVKQRQYINIKALTEPIIRVDQNPLKNCLDCLFKIFYKGSEDETKTESETDRNLTKTQKPLQDIGIFEIQWREPTSFDGSTLPLFNTPINPFQIKQNAIIVSNLLLIFQSLAKFPNLLSRIIFQVGKKYYVHFFSLLKGEKIIWVDNLFPYLNHTEQPMFLSLVEQLWPMILQKALCQYYCGYFQPGKIPLHTIIEEITGSSTHQLDVPAKKTNIFDIANIIKKLQNFNCIYVLQSRQNCFLRSREGRKQCFSVLKLVKEKILINCAFVTDEEKIREAEETIQMKMLKVHYRNPSTMSLWISIDQFHSFFEAIIFCHTHSVMLPKKKLFSCYTTANRIYLNIKFQKVAKMNRIFLTLKEKNCLKSVFVEKACGWSITNCQKKGVQKVCCDYFGDVMVVVDQTSEQIILQIAGTENFHDELFIRSQSDHPIQIQSLDGFLGEYAFMECCKNYYQSLQRREENLIVEEVGEYVLVISTTKEPCLICVPFALSEENIIEGILTESNSKIQMLRYGSIHFIVLMNVCREKVEKMKVVVSKVDGV